MVPPTMVNRMSRSVTSTLTPSRRARVDFIADVIPLTIGPMILTSVQMAAIAMAPAPMSRTSWLNTRRSRRMGRHRPRPCPVTSSAAAPRTRMSRPPGMRYRGHTPDADADERHQGGAEQGAAGADLEVPRDGVADDLELGEQ